jgi:outer membrane protein insertion porin family
MRIPGALLALLLVARGVSAQTPPDQFVGRTIEDVQVFVESKRSIDPTLVDLLETRPGQPLTMAGVRESIAHLFSLGRFQDVRVDASDAPADRVVVRFDLIPIHTVTSVNFRGNLAISTGVLRQAVARYSATPPIGRAAEIAASLQRLYADRGYMRATVTPISEEHHDPDRTLLTFDIDAGPRALIREVAVLGESRTSREAVLRQLHAAPGDPYQRPDLQNRLADYVTQLKKRGFYEATASHQAEISEDGRAADVSITLRAGPKVALRFEGDKLPANRLKELVPVEREGSIDEDLLEDSVESIKSYLRQQGYWHADVTTTREEAAGALTIVFRIERNRKYVLGDEVEITGNTSVPSELLRADPELALPKAGEVFVDSRLAQAAARVADLYRQRGYASVSVKTDVRELDSPPTGDGLVKPAILVNEGPRTVIGHVTITGVHALTEAELRPRIQQTLEGAAYLPRRADEDAAAIVQEYLNGGYSSANVKVVPTFSDDRSRVDVEFQVQEGPQTIVDHILVVGNTHTDPQVILREVQLKPGQPLGLADVLETQRRLSQLGLFRRIRVTELRHGGDALRDVLITVDESPPTTISYGAGVEATQRLRATGPEGEAEQHLEFAPRGFFDIARRNLFGRNRTVDLYTRVSFRPKDAPDDPTQDGKGYGFSEYRVVGTYRAPRAVAGGDLIVTAAVEQGIRSSFNFTRKGVTADVQRRLTDIFRVSGRYSFNTTRTFDERLSDEEQAAIDRRFPRVRLSALSGAIVRDTRDDVIDPERGAVLSAEGNLALRALGGEVGFMKSYLQAAWFHRLPGPRRIVFASRAGAGLADGFPREETDPDGGPPILIEDLPASERFFAGGDTTIRGFALDTVGAPNTISANGFPRGGNALLLFNGELRVPVWGDLGAAFFIDGGNVFERVTQVDFGELRGAIGMGLRYRSPVGPIRIDVGFKMDRREIGGRLEPRTALHFSLGQAF